MTVRKKSLQVGWYPEDAAGVADFLSAFRTGSGAAKAVIAPHAGWFYSGAIAAKAVAALESNAETVVIAGGHLPAGALPLFAFEDAIETPLGVMPIDGQLRDLLMSELEGRADRYRDNTVEALVPMVRFFFPAASLVWLRLPADISSFESGRAIARAAEKLKRKICLVSSTDLTHYGDNYGFSPAGRGDAAREWVSQVNDARFIQAVLSGKPDAVLQAAERDFSSCSAGTVLAALGYAAHYGTHARLLEYGTSADRETETPDSFVGYAALAFE